MAPPSAWIKALLLTAFCLLLASILSVRTSVLKPGTPEWNEPYDHHKYIYMAEHPLGSFHIAPPGTRIAVPFLVKQLPFPAITGFRIQTFVFLVCTAVILYYILLAAGYAEIEAFLGVVMFWSYGAATKLLIGLPYGPDAAGFAIVAAALYFLLKGQDILLTLTLAVGMSVKETAILVVPLIYTLRARRLIDVRAMVRTALIGLPAIAVMLAIGHSIPAYNDVESYVKQLGPQLTEVHLGTTHYNFFDSMRRVTAYRLREETVVNMFRDLTFGNVGILWLLPFFAFGRPVSPVSAYSPNSLSRTSNLILLVRFLPYLALTYLGWFVALNADRRFAGAFPIWIAMSLNGLRALSASWKISIAWFVPVFLFEYLLNLLQPITPAVPVDLAVGTFLVMLGILFSFRDRFGTASETVA